MADVFSKNKNSGGGQFAGEFDNTARSFDAFIDFGYERHSDAIGARINSMGVACDIAAR
jgi:hypothetical protein